MSDAVHRWCWATRRETVDRVASPTSGRPGASSVVFSAGRCTPVGKLRMGLDHLGRRENQVGETLPEMENSIPEVGDGFPHLGNPVIQIGNSISHLGERVPEIGNWFPKIGNRVPQMGFCFPQMGDCSPMIDAFCPEREAVPLRGPAAVSDLEKVLDGQGSQGPK